MAQNLTAHNLDWPTFTGQSLSGSGDRAPLLCIILMMVTMLGEVLLQRLIQSINSRIRGFLHRPMRLVLPDLWAISGPFQRLPFQLLSVALAGTDSGLGPDRVRR